MQNNFKVIYQIMGKAVKRGMKQTEHKKDANHGGGEGMAVKESKGGSRCQRADVGRVCGTL